MNRGEGAKRIAEISAAVLLVTGIAIYFNPYHGIRHDSILYLGQVLAHLRPTQFADDLFFLYGSQAGFTVFPQLIALLADNATIAGVFKTLTVVSLIAFVAASYCLVRVVFPSQWRLPAMVAVLFLPRGYGGWSVFAYAEPFFTARSLAEPILLLALAAWFSSRKLLGGAVCLGAMLLHPLQALGVALIFWVDLVRSNRNWIHGAWVGVPVAALAWMGVQPFDSLALSYDPAWLGALLDSSGQVFLTSWRGRDWGYLITDVFLGWQTARVLARWGHERIVTATLWATLLGLAFSYLLGDLLRLVFPTSVQLWRVQWLLHWLAMAGVPLVLMSEFQDKGFRNPRLWLLIGIISLGTSISQYNRASFALFLILPMYFFWPRLEPRVSDSIRKLLIAGTGLALIASVSLHVFQALKLFVESGASRAVIRPEYVALKHPALGGSLLWAALAVWGRTLVWKGVLGVFLLLFIAAVVQQWDRRSDWTKQLESASGNSMAFGLELPPSAQVYWDGEFLAPWLVLNRPSYFAGEQTAGQVFSRGTALEAVKRRRVLEPLRAQLNACFAADPTNRAGAPCLIDDGAVAMVCAESGKGLDYLVLRARLSTPPLGEWKVKAGQEGNHEIVYWLYGCHEVLNHVRQKGN